MVQSELQLRSKPAALQILLQRVDLFLQREAAMTFSLPTFVIFSAAQQKPLGALGSVFP